MLLVPVSDSGTADYVLIYFYLACLAVVTSVHVLGRTSLIDLSDLLTS